jgi:quinol monooxygenase YgiN
MKFLLFTLTLLITTMSTLATAADTPYRHVVFFKFKDSATPEQVQAIETAFGELAKKIDTVKGYEWGTNVSPEGLNDGFTHCFFVTFADKAGLDAYLPHAEHQAFVAKLKPVLDKVCVVDYVAK